MMKPAKKKESREVVQTVAWLQAVGITTRTSETPNSHLVIETAEGEIEVQVAESEEIPTPAVEHIRILAKDIGSKDREVALRAFHVITETAGFGSPVPVDRGPTPKHKLHYSDNFELVSMRHNEFRRSPNPDPAEFTTYKRIMERACYKFISMNGPTCRRHCLMLDDLMTYARVWLTNYLGNYKVQNAQNNDNEKLLYRYLKQRFAEFAAMIAKKERNTIPSPETVHIALLGKPLDENHRVEGFSTNPLDDEDEVVEEGEKPQMSEGARRNAAIKALEAGLAAMPHDRMVEVLVHAAENRHINVDAQAEAVRRLRAHQKDCEKCRAAATPVVAEAVPEAKPETPAPAPVIEEAPVATVESLRVSFWNSLPATQCCKKCGKDKPKEQFGMRLMNGPKVRESNAKPLFATQPRCKSCR